MEVKVLQPFQVSHAGDIYRPGETAGVPDHVGALWLTSGWVEQVGATKRKPAAKAGVEHEPAAQGE